jgi:hypothetical protein
MSTTLERPTELAAIAPTLPDVSLEPLRPPEPPPPPLYEPSPLARAIAQYLKKDLPTNKQEALQQARTYEYMRFQLGCDCTGSRSRLFR